MPEKGYGRRRRPEDSGAGRGGLPQKRGEKEAQRLVVGGEAEEFPVREGQMSLRQSDPARQTSLPFLGNDVITPRSLREGGKGGQGYKGHGVDLL